MTGGMSRKEIMERFESIDRAHTLDAVFEQTWQAYRKKES